MNPKTPNLQRRRMLQAGAALSLAQFAPTTSSIPAPALLVNDITGLNPVRVARLLAPTQSAHVQQALKAWPGAVSIGGARYSMGGQIAVDAGLHLDMRQMNRVVEFNPQARWIRVQAGMRWREVQGVIDPHGLAVKIMQSFSNFTVGGALSVNAHGRYVGAGPLINSVRAIQLVMPDGTLLQASREREPEIFHAAIGGYGAIGVVTEIELDLVANTRLERQVELMPLSRYRTFFEERIQKNPDAVMHNADLAPPLFDKAASVTWYRTNQALTNPARLTPAGKSYPLESSVIWALTELPGGPVVRADVIDPILHASRPVVWRNHEASLDVASLGPISGRRFTFALQEYFVPKQALTPFVARMTGILKEAQANVLNVSVRHSPADPGSMLAWATQEVFSLVLYYKQGRSEAAQAHTGKWTRALIETAIALGGRYYLPYQLHASPEQFFQAYPHARRFLAFKKTLDPHNRLRNRFLEKYLG